LRILARRLVDRQVGDVRNLESVIEHFELFTDIRSELAVVSIPVAEDEQLTRPRMRLQGGGNSGSRRRTIPHPDDVRVRRALVFRRFLLAGDFPDALIDQLYDRLVAAVEVDDSA
jgi:hypothetical protein